MYTNTNSIKDTSTIQTVFRLILGAMLIFAGTGHLSWSRLEFVAQVPNWLPVSADVVVVLSGIVEVALGASLLFLARQKHLVGWVVALFFVMVFPGNISQYMTHTSAFGLDNDQKRLIRLLFQPLLVIWALWSTGAWKAWRTSK